MANETITKFDEEMEMTPGGRCPKIKIQSVQPGQAVQRDASGATGVVVADGETTSTATGLVLTPGGYRSTSLVHKIEPGSVINGEQSRFRKLDASGRTLADLGPL